MEKPTGKRKWGGLAVLTLALAIIIIDTTLINVSLRTIVGDLKTTVQNIQWVITGYSLVLSAFTITGGRLGDLFGRKKMFVGGAIVFAAGSIVAATSNSIAQLIVGASIIEGLGAALMMPATASLLVSTFRGRERAIAFGVWGGVAGAASAFGPLVGGYLTTYYNWRYGYGINVVIVAILLAFSWLVIDARDERKRPSIDFVGILLSAVGLASIVYAIVQSSTDGWFRAKQMAHFFNWNINLGDYSLVPFVLAFGILILIIFALWEFFIESKNKTPLVSPEIFLNTPFVAGITTVAIIAMGQFGVLFTLPVFFQSVRDLDAFHTGLAFLPFSLTALFAAPISGAIGSKKLSPKILIVTGLFINVIGMWLLHNALTPDASVANLRLPLIIFGAGFGMAFAQLNNVTLSAVSVREAGEASGINNTARQLGATLGNAIIGSVLIASLTSHYASSIASSTTLPTQAKPMIQHGVKTQVQSLGQAGGPKSLPPKVASELTRIRKVATAQAVQHALVYGTVIVGLGFFASLRLPGGHQTHPGEGAPSQAEVSAAKGRKKPLSL